MKKLIFLLALMGLSICADAQIFNQHKRALKAAERRAENELRQGADFVLDPIEQVPTDVKSSKRFAASAISNWGVDYLLPANLKERLRQECSFKVLVKVADTGDPDHTALRQGKLPAKNYTTDQTAADGNGHGTHVSGIIAADGFGVLDALVDKGIAQHKSVKILSNAGSGSFTWVATAFAAERAEDLAFMQSGGFVVYNGSFGGGTSLVGAVEAELQKGTDAGIIYVFASGNTGGVGVNYPGNGKYSIATASLDQGLSRSYYSTMGPEVWAAMPGRNITSTYKGQTYASLSGTSMASPFLTAAVAVGFSKWGPKMGKLDRVRAYIAWCAKDLGAPGKDSEYGWGVGLIQNILDRDPTNTPGLPPPPPPPPPGGGDGLTGVSPVTITLDKDYIVNWDNLSPAAEATPRTFKTAGRGVKKQNKGFAGKQTKVRFTVTFKTTKSAADAARQVEASADKYFRNRGFLLPAAQDESWAALYAAYFLEMGLQQGEQFEIDVTRVVLQTAGHTVTITDPLLWHWPRS